MSRETHEPEIIDITNYQSRKADASENYDNLKFLRLKKEKIKMQSRLNFLYSITNFLLIYNIFLTIAIFYFLVIKG